MSGEVVLTLGAVLGLASVVLTLAALCFGITPLVFRSGSMAPTIGTGALALAHDVPATALRVGDVVSVPYDGTRVTHRIVRIDRTGDSVSLVLRGDANPVADPAPYRVAHADRVFAHVPWLGYAVAWTGSWAAPLVAGPVLVALLLGLFRSRPDRGTRGVAGRRRSRRATSQRGHRGGRGRGSTRPVGIALAVVLLGTGTALRAAPAWSAGWSDTSAVSSGSFTAWTVTKPVISCKRTGTALSGYTIVMSWPAVTIPHALSYTAKIPRNPSQPTVTTSGGVSSVTITSKLLSTLLGDSATLQVTATLPGTSPAWTSVGSHDFSISLLGVGVGCSGSSY